MAGLSHCPPNRSKESVFCHSSGHFVSSTVVCDHNKADKITFAFLPAKTSQKSEALSPESLRE